MRVLLVSIIAVFIMPSAMSADSDVEHPIATGAVTTAHQALDRAMGMMGFDGAKFSPKLSASEAAARVMVEDDKTPFFHDRIVGQEIWRVTFDSVYVHIPGLMPAFDRNQVPKTYDVFLEPETGVLLKIESRYEGGDSTLSDELPPEEAAADMKMNGVEYVDVVMEPPKVDFYEALQIARPSYGANARQIVAHLAMCSYGSEQVRPVWSILGRGTPPWHGSGLGANIIPVWQKNRILCLVDATTGQLIAMMKGIPHVEPPDGWPSDSIGTGE